MRTKNISAIVMLFLLLAAQASEGEIQQSSRRPTFTRVSGIEEVEIAKPFKVRTVRGMIYYGEKEPLAGAFFELHASNGRSFRTNTNENGEFKLSDVPPGTYDFRATLAGFNTTIGKVIVSHGSIWNAAIKIRLAVSN